MKKKGLLRAIGLTIVTAALALPILSCVQEKAPVIKVLVRRTSVSEIALDGAQFLDLLSQAAAKASPPFRERVLLDSTGSLLVVRDSQLLSPGESAAKWEKNPAEFDFLIEWRLKHDEHSKTTFLESLTISVSESWKVEKVSDSSVTKSWTTSYDVEGENLSASDEAKERKAAEQTEKVIAPARGPILEEIRAFLKANQTQQ